MGRHRMIILKGLLVVLLGFQLMSIIGNVTVSFLLRSETRSPSPCSPVKSHADREKRRTDKAATFSTDFVHSLLNDTLYSGVDKYKSYVINVVGRKDGREEDLFNADVIINDVTSFHYPIDIGPCKIKVEQNTTKNLFVSVVTAPANFKRRRDIRRTWLRHLKDKRQLNSSVQIVGFGFVMGLTIDDDVQLGIEQESRAHGDIIQVGMMDAYYDLAIKGVAFFNWLNENCRKVDYILKVDDDVYINVRNLTSVVASLPPLRNYSMSIYGFNESFAPPQRGFN